MACLFLRGINKHEACVAYKLMLNAGHMQTEVHSPSMMATRGRTKSEWQKRSCPAMAEPQQCICTLLLPTLVLLTGAVACLIWVLMHYLCLQSHVVAYGCHAHAW